MSRADDWNRIRTESPVQVKGSWPRATRCNGLLFIHRDYVHNLNEDSWLPDDVYQRQMRRRRLYDLVQFESAIGSGEQFSPFLQISFFRIHDHHHDYIEASVDGCKLSKVRLRRLNDLLTARFALPGSAERQMEELPHRQSIHARRA